MSGNSCNPLPMEQWFGTQTKDGECRPCATALITRWYAEELRKVGAATRADGLVDLAETTIVQGLSGADDEEEAYAQVDLRSVGRELDRIKTEFPQLVAKFKEFDCAAQETAVDLLTKTDE